MSQQRIFVKTGGSGSGTQETYNATQSNFQWSFSLANIPGGICENSNIFTLEPHGSSGTAIKAGDNERYLSLTVNGAGVPDSNPTFTSINTSGQSAVKIMGTPVTVTRFDQDDNKDGETAFGFTVKVQRRGGEGESFKYYFVPGSFLIGIMLTKTPQYVFEVRS